MEFVIDTAESLDISDVELMNLLSEVYTGGGFTSNEDARKLFEAKSVRGRGKLFCAKEKSNSTFAGMVILVYPNTPAIRIAAACEAEMHLLAVLPEYRRSGLGRLLVQRIIDEARKNRYKKILLYTQPSMKAAHRLYASLGFKVNKNRDFVVNEREFHVYELPIDD